MFSYPLVKFLRENGEKVDHRLRQKLLHIYKPFKWVPCFFHNIYGRFIDKMKKVSVIIEFKDGMCTHGIGEVDKLLSAHSRCKVRHHFTRVSCCSADVTPHAMKEMLNKCSSIKKVYLNREVKALLDTAVPASHAENVVRNDTVLTGSGVTVAVIDTGIHPHEDLLGRITGFADFIDGRTQAYDDNGHGTHVAGAVAGNGRSAGGEYQGPAPEANVIGVKVLNKTGAGSLETVMQGVDWCISYNERNPDRPINIINLSLGSPAQRFDQEEDDPLVKIVNAAWDRGIVVCAAAGNDGPSTQTIASPGLSGKIITVGALDNRNSVEREDDDVASFSSRGPTIYGKTKPDLLAPGVEIISLRSPNSYLDKLQKQRRVGEAYISMSGTSMATPICAGVCALYLQHHPEDTPEQVKRALMRGTDLWRDRYPNIYGAGYINAEKTI
ncbi:S8 family peptidase [Bacillus shivajii]|uniref:S8 family peptidase n=1 Tax=Bacillus shivajii TaxID=1983719 RepID=UPI001CFB61F8|nr:S8 family peptidase [Bacillus shivajii]UCZ53946.1 S8 family peptidase [Bacillus shivajii]